MSQHLRRISTAGALALCGFLLAPIPSARAERDIRLLMDMDHHLVRADFIAVISVSAMWFYTDASGPEMQHVDAELADVVTSRWDLGDSIEFNTNAGFQHLEAGKSYLVLMSGGPWAVGPFTHRDNSVFEIDPDGRLVCSGGDMLYGVLGDGFYCAPEGTVVGEPLGVDEALERIACLRDRAIARLPNLAYDLDKLPRPLELDPSPAEKLEVRR